MPGFVFVREFVQVTLWFVYICIVVRDPFINGFPTSCNVVDVVVSFMVKLLTISV